MVILAVEASDMPPSFFHLAPDDKSRSLTAPVDKSKTRTAPRRLRSQMKSEIEA
jgi:hypothetical protein